MPTPLLSSSPALVDYALKMRAYDTGGLVARTSTRRFQFRQTARLVSVITSPADQAGIWGIAHSRVGASSPTVAAVGDPGSYTAQLQLFDQLGQQWGMWIKTTLEAGGLPQLIYPSLAARDALTWAAQRIWAGTKTSPAARGAAALILNSSHLARTTGSMAAPTALELIREHYVSPLDTVQEVHLGTWLDYPKITATSDRSFTALDEQHTETATALGKAFDKMQTLEGERRASRAARLIPLLEPHLTARHKDLAAALNLLEQHPGPVAPYLEEQAQADTQALTRAMAGPYAPNRANLPAAIATLSDREKALEKTTKTLWATDQLEQLRGIASGDVLTGTPNGPTLTVTGPIRAREEDTYTTPTGTGGTFVVTGLQATSAGTILAFNKTLPEGAPLVLVPTIGATRTRWVKETWVTTGTHQAEEPPAGKLPAAAAGQGPTVWAESLKS